MMMMSMLIIIIKENYAVYHDDNTKDIHNDGKMSSMVNNDIND